MSPVSLKRPPSAASFQAAVEAVVDRLFTGTSFIDTTLIDSALTVMSQTKQAVNLQPAGLQVRLILAEAAGGVRLGWAGIGSGRRSSETNGKNTSTPKRKKMEVLDSLCAAGTQRPTDRYWSTIRRLGTTGFSMRPLSVWLVLSLLFTSIKER